MGVGFCDPDADERGETSRPKRPVHVTELQEAALRATRHVSRTGATTYFSSKEHVKRFKALEEKARGAGDEGFLFKKWMEYNIRYVATINEKTMVIGMGNLLKRMENEDRRIDWMAANRMSLWHSAWRAPEGNCSGSSSSPSLQRHRKRRRQTCKPSWPNWRFPMGMQPRTAAGVWYSCNSQWESDDAGSQSSSERDGWPYAPNDLNPSLENPEIHQEVAPYTRKESGDANTEAMAGKRFVVSEPEVS